MRRGIRTVVRELRELGRNARPYSTTFIYNIPQEVRASVEASLKDSFEIWWKSWIAPKLDELEAKAPKRKAKQ